MQYKFDELLQFPCSVDFRIIIDSQKEHGIEELCSEINKVYKNSVEKISKPPRTSKNGNFMSYTVPVIVQSAADLENIYKMISKLDYVKHII